MITAGLAIDFARKGLIEVLRADAKAAMDAERATVVTTTVTTTTTEE